MPRMETESSVESKREWFKVFESHGVMLDEKGDRREVESECPICGRENRFYVNRETGQWKCHRGECQGNAHSFITQFYDVCKRSTKSNSPEFLKLAADRRLTVRAMQKWGVVFNPLKGKWLVPGHNVIGQSYGKLQQLYRYISIKRGDGAWHKALMPTPELYEPGNAHRLFGIPLFDRKKPDVWVCEGPWDAIALWEALGQMGLLEDANVIAVPGCNVFSPKWSSLFAGRNVKLLFDNDYPRTDERTNTTHPSTGWAGMVKVSSLLMKADVPPSSIQYLHWGEEGHTRNYPDGYDVRDHLTLDVHNLPQKKERLSNLIAMLRDSPESWRHNLDRRTMNAVPDVSQPGLPLLPCESFQEVEDAFKQTSLEWSPGLRGGLAFNFAIILSTELRSDQIWGILMSAPGTAKTTLAEAMSANTDYVYPKDDLTGISSGYKVDAEGAQNFSMIAKLKNKTLILKDADTLLRNPNRPKIMSEFRALYDRVFRSEFKQGMGRDWEGQNTTVILNGTSAMMELDASEKGARFLVYCIMDDIEEEMERRVGWKVINATFDNLSALSNGKPETRESPEMTRAKQLTGGYINYLRQNVQSLLQKHEGAATRRDYKERCLDVGEFVAFMRSRQPKSQDEIVDREFSPRLVRQHGKLMGCLAAVLNKDAVDEEVVALVTKVGLDTARGKTLDLAHVLRRSKRRGMLIEGIAHQMHETDKKMDTLLRFLARIKVVEEVRLKGEQRWRWRLTQRLTDLYDAVVGVPEEE